jgi:NAD(P)-dependent dehydrogenase (short-subunit alcohol dehydrogenase family)
MDKSFKDHTAMLTGAAGGLGSALALQFAGRGARLMLLDKDSRGLDRIHDLIVDKGFEAPAICTIDLSRAGPDEFEQISGVLRDEFEGLNHLVHCAAEFDGLSPLDQIQPADWLRCMQVNLNAAWLITVQYLPMLKRNPVATVTFVLDDNGKSESANWGAYGVSKSAIRSLANMLSDELEGSGVRILAVNPGPMRTSLRARAYFAEDPECLPAPIEAAQEIMCQIDRV